jgi:hypothetical protein
MELKKVLVNPRIVDGKPLTVYNIHGQTIPRTEHGTAVPTTAFYNRLLRDRDLEKVEEKKPVKTTKQE